VKDYTLRPGKKANLSRRDPRDTDGLSKDDPEVEKQTAQDIAKLGELQELLYVAGANSMLVVLQGMDTSGKDGVVKRVFEAVNPIGCRVVPFKVPTPLERAHDYLWRVHAQTPELGQIVIFNRSHYEAVLVERIHAIAPPDRVKERYEEINWFERTLAREGTIIVKFFLHISKEEQEERLRERIATPEKGWKVSAGDWAERRYWDAYQEAYEEMLEKTSTDWAPWTIVPSDHKWYRNLVVARTLVDAADDYIPRWKEALKARTEANLAELRTYEQQNGLR
jgi:PPK2 family polyphosphate:nucleotide phosphotransferase